MSPNGSQKKNSHRQTAVVYRSVGSTDSSAATEDAGPKGGGGGSPLTAAGNQTWAMIILAYFPVGHFFGVHSCLLVG